MTCLICKKPIDDDGLLFCSGCRKKDWKIRFKAIREKEKERWGSWKSKGSPGRPPKEKETSNLYIDYKKPQSK